MHNQRYLHLHLHLHFLLLTSFRFHFRILFYLVHLPLIYLVMWIACISSCTRPIRSLCIASHCLLLLSRVFPQTSSFIIITEPICSITIVLDPDHFHFIFQSLILSIKYHSSFAFFLFLFSDSRCASTFFVHSIGWMGQMDGFTFWSARFCFCFCFRLSSLSLSHHHPIIVMKILLCISYLVQDLRIKHFE